MVFSLCVCCLFLFFFGGGKEALAKLSTNCTSNSLKGLGLERGADYFVCVFS